MKEKILEILSGIKPEADFTASRNFVMDGLLDSLGMVTLMEEIEEEYDITIPASEISLKNFSTIESIVALVEKYM